MVALSFVGKKLGAFIPHNCHPERPTGVEGSAVALSFLGKKVGAPEPALSEAEGFGFSDLGKHELNRHQSSPHSHQNLQVPDSSPKIPALLLQVISC